ncbi:hypothetical protein [Nocardioides piscis]|uniref:hypothetical protein n=1 Tax=Nocardioides piscis TaxID=2714938 RepID=UPI001FE7C128|nr:hypothetical protein [Nocardioides piscis]
MTGPTDVRTLLEQVQGQEAWAVIRRKAAPTAGIVGGTRSEVDSLLDIPLETGVPEEGRSVDRLVAVPFRQIAERGFDVIDDGTPLVVVDITEEHEVSVGDLLAALPDLPVEFADRGASWSATTTTESSSTRSWPTRSGWARAPTWSSGVTTARSSPTGTPTAR